MIKHYNIDFTIYDISEAGTKIQCSRIYNIIKNYINDYRLIYKETPFIYIVNDSINYLL